MFLSNPWWDIYANDNYKKPFRRLFGLLVCMICVNNSFAQCSTISAPTYLPNLCLYEYFTSISASGSGVTSTIAYTASSCSGTYANYYSTQGIKAYIGSIVSVNVSRFTTTYNAYLSIYVDWNNNGTYEPSELVGPMIALPLATPSALYDFVVPCGAVMGPNLHMRVMLSETAAGAGAPCTGTYGEACDFYFIATCPSVAISGPTEMCRTQVSAFTTTGYCGTWSSSNTAVAVVSSSGAVTGVGDGTTAISYTTPSCGSSGLTVTVQGATVTGPPEVCLGWTVTHTASIPGGTWSGWDPLIVAGVGSGATVTLGGGHPGITSVTYTDPVTGCSVTDPFSVLYDIYITGPANICMGGTITYTSNVLDGLWGSSNPSVASISPSGVLHAISPGTTTISTDPPSGEGICSPTVATLTVTVDSLYLYGSVNACVGSTDYLYPSFSGGTWSTSNPSLATVSSGGAVTYLSPGTVTIYYSTPLYGACSTSKTITISTPPGLTSGSPICVGSYIFLGVGTLGGVFSTQNGSIAAVNSSGQVTGVASGTTNISYTLGGCSSITQVTINATPGLSLSSSTLTCGGASATATSSMSGTWSSSNPGIATISTSGVINGLATGVATISCSTSLCSGTAAVTVVPPTISGPSQVCVGSTINLSVDASGGTWSTSNGRATVSSGGVVTGVSAGSVTISYIRGSGCIGTYAVTVVSLPTITGASTVCAGTSTTLTGSPGGGPWSSSDGSIAAVNSSGQVSAVSNGVVTISYTQDGCTATKTVSSVIPSISGPYTVCEGSPGTLTGNPSGGAWSGGSTIVATISSGGTVTALSAGSASITYTVAGCVTTYTVYATPPPSISGPSSVCGNAALLSPPAYGLTTTVYGGAWSCSNTAIATLGGSVLVPASYASGHVTITYAMGGTCPSETLDINVVAQPFFPYDPSPSDVDLYITESSPCPSGWSYGAIAGPAGGTWSISTGSCGIYPITPWSGTYSYLSYEWINGVCISCSDPGNVTYTMTDGTVSCAIHFLFYY